jgi:hypothetical protein
MKRLFLFCILFASFFTMHGKKKATKYISSAITYELNGGRFGDNLLSYSRAKWLSYQSGLPLYYKRFPYCHELKLFKEEEYYYTDDIRQNFARIKYTATSQVLKPYNNTLYINTWDTQVNINWNDSVFIEELKRMIAPRYDIQTVSIPEGYVSIAAHVRNGGGYAVDNWHEKERCPLRFVPEEFFIDQIKRIAQMYPDQRLYVYIFTDHKEPEKLVNKFAQALEEYNITFGCHCDSAGHNVNVLEDFFSMMKFDCLIRPGSHFSRFVERLGNNKLVIYPRSVIKLKDQPAIINMIGIKHRTDKGWKTIKVQIA